jgi:hypothetical protein
MPKRKQAKVKMECTGDDIFVVFNGARIAKRGYPETPQAKTGCRLSPAGECWMGGTALISSSMACGSN